MINEDDDIFSPPVVSTETRALVWKLLPFLVAAFFITLNSATASENKRDNAWTTPAVLIGIFAYLIFMKTQDVFDETGGFHIASIAWIVWLVRREVYIHHGEPWLGVGAFIARLIFIHAILVSTFIDKLWRKRHTSMMLLQFYTFLFFVPYAADNDSVPTDITANIVSPLMKTILFLLLPFLLDPYWKEEPSEDARNKRNGENRAGRCEYSGADNRMIIQYTSVFSVAWYISVFMPISIALMLKFAAKTKTLMFFREPETTLVQEDEEQINETV